MNHLGGVLTHLFHCANSKNACKNVVDGSSGSRPTNGALACLFKSGDHNPPRRLAQCLRAKIYVALAHHLRKPNNDNLSITGRLLVERAPECRCPTNSGRLSIGIATTLRQSWTESTQHPMGVKAAAVMPGPQKPTYPTST